MSLATTSKANKHESATIGIVGELLNKLRGLEVRMQHRFMGTGYFYLFIIRKSRVRVPWWNVGSFHATGSASFADISNWFAASCAAEA
jgi:hypothetical protein